MGKNTELNCKCPECGQSTLVADTFDSSVEVNGVEYPVRGLEFSNCTNCGADPVLRDQARRNDGKFSDVRRAAQGLLTSQEIAAVRTGLGLNQRECSLLFGGGKNSFHKYESGAVCQSLAMDILLRVVASIPDAFRFIVQQRGMTELVRQELISRQKNVWTLGLPNESIKYRARVASYGFGVSEDPGAYFVMSANECVISNRAPSFGIVRKTKPEREAIPEAMDDPAEIASTYH
ncbi:type II TA system antitoxin MqsA family protein [Elongatibacter sediminis]|uniref:Type II TA system antitoxin MqsA family protein n=1 Tax=Elongatibacter sediminis TaxID=3119006 RepID=A0AAW9RGZ0_9GAMM